MGAELWRCARFQVHYLRHKSGVYRRTTPPLQTTASGVSVKVTVSGTATQALLYYISPGQINAVLPSATPVGAGTITVTTAAGTSAGSPIQVGLGPVQNDATGVPVRAPIEVDIGGTPAQVQYHGRSGYVGLDQINALVLDGVSVPGASFSGHVTVPPSVLLSLPRSTTISAGESASRKASSMCPNIPHQ